MKLNRTGSNWNELERSKINENWRIIEGGYNDVVGQITDEVVGHLIDSAKLNWKVPVETEADLPSGASEGDTRMVRDSGKVYRFNGEVWQEIQQIDAGPVNEMDARLTAQLADKANKSEIQSLAINKAEKTYVDDVARTKRDKATPIGLNDVSSELLAAIEGGEGTSFDLLSIPKEHSVSVSSTDFVKAGKNLFNKNNIIMGRAINHYTGGLIDSSEYGYVDYFRVKPNTQYHRSYYNATIAFYTIDKEFITGFASGRGAVTAPSNAYYARLSIYALNPLNLNGFQFEEGDTETPYESYKIEIPGLKVEGKPATFNTSVIAQSNGLVIDFEKSEVRTIRDGVSFIAEGKRYKSKDGTFSFSSINANSIHLGFEFSTESVLFFEINDLESLDFEKYGIFGVMRVNQRDVHINGTGYSVVGGSNQGRPAFNAFLVSQEGGFIVDFKKQEIRTRRISTFLFVNGEQHSPIDGVFSFKDLSYSSMIIAFNIASKEIEFLRASSVTQIDYGKYGILGVMRRNEETLLINGETYDLIRSSRHSDHRMILLGDDFSDYTPETPYTPMADTTNAQFIYDQYDALMTQYPNYITKRELARTVNGLPIYLYEFKEPPVKTFNYEHPVPKILFSGATHGHENHAVFSDITFFQDLCHNWRNQKSLRFIRANTHILLIPLLNPEGYELNQRKNGNGVDIARNFPAKWGEHPEDNSPDSPYYAGPSPASEIETNVIIDLLNDHPDIYFVLEHHNSPSLEDSGNLSWMGTNSQLIRKIIAAFGQSWTMKAKQDFPVLENENINFIDPVLYDKGGSMCAYIQSIGVNGVILETANGMGTTDEDMQVITTDIIGNIILAVLRSHEYLSQ